MAEGAAAWGPAFRVYNEQPAERRAVHDRQIRPVCNVLDKVVRIYGFCIQGMAPAASKAMDLRWLR